MESKQAYWDGVIANVDFLMNILKRKPRQFKMGYVNHPGAILNAYRHGDLTFDQTVKALEKWKKTPDEE